MTSSSCDKCEATCSCAQCQLCVGIACMTCDDTGKPIKGSDFGTIYESPVVKVVVGSQQTAEFHVHRDLLISHEYFKRALLDFPGEEKATNTIKLTDSCALPSVFRCFVEFLYKKDYEVNDLANANACVIHARVYVFAEGLCIEALKTQSLQKLSEILSKALPVGVATAYYCNSCGSSHCRNYLMKPGCSRYYCSRCSYNHCSYTVSSSSAASEPALDASVAVKLVSIIYGHTSNRYPPEADFKISDNLNSEPMDQARTLIAKFCAMNRSSFMNSGKFRAAVRHFGEFSEDLLSFTQNGTGLL